MSDWLLSRGWRYSRMSLCLGIFSLAALFTRSASDIFHLPKLTAFFLSLAIAGGIWTATVLTAGGPRLPWARLLIPAGVFIMANVISGIASDARAMTILGNYERYGGIVPYLIYAMAMTLIVWMYWASPERLKDLAWAVVAGSSILTLYILVQALGWDWVEWSSPDGKPLIWPTGTMGNSNFAGAFLAMGLPFVILVALGAKTFLAKIAFLAVALIQVHAILLTQTRGGMIAAVTGLLAMGFLMRDRLPGVVRVTAVVVAVILAVIAVRAVVFRDPRPERSLAAYTLRTDTLRLRAHYWQGAYAIFKDHPITGTGPDTFQLYYPRYRSPAEAARQGFDITDKPHNVYLEHAANLGIGGIISFLGMMIMAAWYALRAVRKASRSEGAVLAAFAGALAAYAAQATFSIDVPPIAAMFWICVGGLAAIADPASMKARQRLELAASALREGPARRGKRYRKKNSNQKSKPAAMPPGVLRLKAGGAEWFGRGAVAVVAMVLVLFGLLPLRADFKNHQGEFEEAMRLNPLEASYRDGAAKAAERVALMESDLQAGMRRGLGLYREALRLQPGSIFHVTNIARLYSLGSRRVDPQYFPIASQWWERAVALDPVNPEIRDRQGALLMAWARETQREDLWQRSAEVWEKAIELKPSLDAWVNLARSRRELGDLEGARAALLQAEMLRPGSATVRKLEATLSANPSLTLPGGRL